jgi:dienelactone hydrolase
MEDSEEDQIESAKSGQQTLSASVEAFDVTFPSDGLQLRGLLRKPRGNGPFPAILWNHGSGTTQATDGASLAEFYVKRGYVIFFPARRGHGYAGHLPSPGVPVGDAKKELRRKGFRGQAFEAEVIKLHEFYNRDVIAALEWLKKQSYVDSKRIVMSGLSYGGIQTILSAETANGVRGFIPFGAAAMSWEGSPLLQERLIQAIRRAKSPIFLLQAQNDYSLGPSERLGPELLRKGSPSHAKIYPAWHPERGHKAGHGGFANFGQPLWGSDVLEFLNQVNR